MTVIVTSTKYVSVLSLAVGVTEACADDEVVVDVKNMVGTACVLFVGLAGVEEAAGIGIDVLVGCGFCWDALDPSTS